MTTGVTPEIEILRLAIQDRYSELAHHADHTFHFHHGRPLAELLGYQKDLVDAMPPQAVESFAGVGNPFSVGTIDAGDVVLDVGSGGGFDSFVAAQAVGPTGKVIAVDMTDAMLEKSRSTSQQMGIAHIDFRKGLVEEMPVESESVDVAISNGVINLCADKHKAFSEIYRVLRSGGRMFLSDIVVHKPVPDAAKANVDLWTAWIGGALLEEEYLNAIKQAGFIDVELVSSIDVFAGSEGESNAHAFETFGVNIRATRIWMGGLSRRQHSHRH